MRRILVGILSVAVAAVVAGCGSGGGGSTRAAPTAVPAAAAPTVAAPQVIEIKAIERGDQYLYDPAAVRIKAGAVTVKFTNSGERAHSLNIRKQGSTDVIIRGFIEVGQSTNLDLTLAEGTYEFICLVRGHADRGQVGSLTVTSGGAESEESE